MPEEKIPHIFALIEGMDKVNNPAENYLSDKIYVGGIGALDLILFQILASMGQINWTAYLAWAGLAVSLPCTAAFLYVSFLKDKKNIPLYSPIHEKLALLSVITGGISAVATMWHFWVFSGILLLITSIAAYTFCALYKIAINENFEKVCMLLLTELNNDQTKATTAEDRKESE